MNNSISIIIPTYNRSTFLNLTLAGYVNQTYKKFNLVIVDDGSSDDTKAIVDSYKDLLDINYIYQENKGRSFARNVGLKSTNATNIIFCDDDRIPNLNFVAAHQLHMKENKKSVAVGLKEKIITRYDSRVSINEKQFNIIMKYFKESKEEFTPKMFFTEKDLIENFNNIVNTFSVGISRDNYTEVLEHYGNDLVRFKLPWILGTTANMSFTRSNIDDFLFDEHYASWGMEDTDFAYMLYKKGYQFSFIEGANNYHQLHPSNYRAEKDSLNKNIKYFCQKYDELECYLFANLFGVKRFSIMELNVLYSTLLQDPNNSEGLIRTLKKLITNTTY